MTKKSTYIFIGVLFICIIVAGLTISNLKEENKNLEERITLVEARLKTQPETGELSLICLDRILVFGQTNGIGKYGLKNLEVQTTYPIVLYQVVGKDGKILQNDFYQNETTIKKYKFMIEGVTEDLTEIRLSGYDKDGNQIETKAYKFIYKD